MADDALPIQGTWTPPTPPTPGGAAASAPTVGDAPAVVTATGAPSAGAAGAVQGAWSAPTPPTPGGAADAAPTVGDAPAVVVSTGAPSAGAASAVTGAWSAPTPPTPGGAAASAPTVGDAPAVVMPEPDNAPAELVPTGDVTITGLPGESGATLVYDAGEGSAAWFGTGDLGNYSLADGGTYWSFGIPSANWALHSTDYPEYPWDAAGWDDVGLSPAPDFSGLVITPTYTGTVIAAPLPILP